LSYAFLIRQHALDWWFFSFDEVYDVTPLETIITEEMSAADFFEAFINNLYVEIRNKMAFADALILKEAKSHNIPTIITWNKKHFEHRNHVRILTPEEFNMIFL